MKLPRICGGFLNVTQKCNLACKYCFVKQQPLEISYQVAKDAIDFYAKNAVKEAREPSVNFFGGEPMLRYKDIIKPLVEYIRKTYGDYDIGITTNGTLLNREVYEFFKKNNVGMLLSIDGNKETQDFNRPYHSGKGSFDDIDLDMHLEYYPDTTFRATLDNDTVSNMFDNFMFAVDKGFKAVTFIPNVFVKWTNAQIEVFKEQSYKIFDYIKDNPNIKLNFIENGKEYLKKLKKIDENYFRNKGQNLPACGTCGLGGGAFGSIGSSGDVYSCQEMCENPEFTEFVIGNIYTGIDDNKRKELSCSFNTRNVKCESAEKCKSCELYRVCSGGCSINNFFKTGSLEIMPEIFCIYEQIGLELAKKLEGVK